MLATNSAGNAGSTDETAPSAPPSDQPPATSDAPAPIATGLLHSSKRFYLDEMLKQPGMARVREAIKKLPPEKRLAQTCNIEAVAQIGSAGRGFTPDALIADAFAKPAITGTTYEVSNGAFRSGQQWYAVAYKCTLSSDLASVASFAFRIGDEVTDALKARTGG